MGQQEVMEFLDNNQENWYTAKQISRFTKINVSSITGCLKKLREFRFVRFEAPLDKYKNHIYRYKYKNIGGKE